MLHKNMTQYMHSFTETRVITISCIWLHNTFWLFADADKLYSCNCFCRVNSYIANGWATQNLVNPDECSGFAAPNLMPSLESTFNGKWINIKNAYSRPEEVPLFNHGHMISYFVSRTAVDGLALGSVNKQVSQVFV